MDSNILGMDNRFAAQLQASSNKITFTQHAGGFPEDTVDVFNPNLGFYGVYEPDIRNKRLNTVAAVGRGPSQGHALAVR